MAITNGYITADQFRQFITPPGQDLISSGPDDAVIDELITGVSRYIDGITRRTFYARTETHTYDVPAGRDLLIMDDDLLTITTLTNGNSTVIAAADYILYPANATPKYSIRIKESSSIYWQGSTTGNYEQAISVAGTWGYATTAPADIQQAVYEICKSIYSRRYGDNTTAEAIIAPGGYVIEPRDVTPMAWKTLMRYQRLA